MQRRGMEAAPRGYFIRHGEGEEGGYALLGPPTNRPHMSGQRVERQRVSPRPIYPVLPSPRPMPEITALRNRVLAEFIPLQFRCLFRCNSAARSAAFPLVFDYRINTVETT